MPEPQIPQFPKRMPEKYRVEFTTSCYEKDWELILKTNRLQRMIAACNYEFKKKTLYINNVKNFDKVACAAELHKKNGIIDDYIRVDQYAEEAMKFFKIQKGPGYYYLIQFLITVYLGSCDYLLNFSGDSILVNDEEWIDTAIEKMQQNKRIIVANALYDGNFKQAMRESFKVDDHFYMSFGFSDQCYLIRPEFFKADIYNEESELSVFYPERGRGSFEERIYKFMRNHEYYRITHKRAVYRHKNLAKNKLKIFLALNLGINRKKYRID